MYRKPAALEPPSHVEQTAALIKDYLRNRSEALETVEGIARWWLSRQRFDDSIKVVQQALDLLIAQGAVERLAIAGGQALYRRAHAPSHSSLVTQKE